MTDSNRESEHDYKNRLNAKLQDSGEIDQLKHLLRQRLNESGWTAEMKSILKGFYYLFTLVITKILKSKSRKIILKMLQ